MFAETRQIQDNTKIYTLLKKEVEERGLMRGTPFYYIKTTLMIAVLITGAMVLAFGAHNLFWFATGSIIFGFLAVQSGYIGHDAAHMQISRNKVIAMIFGQFGMTLILGMGYHYWKDRHNTHHSKPNDEALDPDVNDMPYAYSEEKAMAMTGLWKFTSKWQEFSLFTVPLFVFHFLRFTSWQYLLKNKKPIYLVDLAVVLGHYSIFLALPIALGGLFYGILFYLIYSAVAGFYFGLVFIPNHLGMPVVREKMDFMTQQVITSRDIKTPRWLDFFYGGLNYQIEHHLFPTMSRKNLHKAKPIVKEYCEKNNLRYHEPGLVSTYKELLTFSRKIGLTIRRYMHNVM